MLARLQEVVEPAKPGVRPQQRGGRNPVLRAADAWPPRRKALVASLAASLLVWSSFAVRAEPLPGEAAGFIEEKIRAARVLSNGRKALVFCRAAQGKAAQYDRDAFYQGMITTCIAGAELKLLLQYRTSACRHLQQALAALREVSSDHPDYDILKADVEAVRLGAAQLTCRPGDAKPHLPE